MKIQKKKIFKNLTIIATLILLTPSTLTQEIVVTKTESPFGGTITKIIKNYCKPKSCIRCIESEESYDCERCIHYGTEEFHNRCSEKHLKQTNGMVINMINNCEGFYMSAEKCFMCQSQMMMFVDLKGEVTACEYPKKDTFKKRCIVGKSFQRVGKNERDERCYVCKGGIPSKDNGNCWDYEADKKYFDIERVNFENCEYGVRASENGTAICATCTLDTFAVVGDRDSEYFGMCRRLQNDNKGCAKTVGGKCIWCNHYRGYYMVRPGVCKKWLEILGVFCLGLLIVLF